MGHDFTTIKEYVISETDSIIKKIKGRFERFISSRKKPEPECAVYTQQEKPLELNEIMEADFRVEEPEKGLDDIVMDVNTPAEAELTKEPSINKLTYFKDAIKKIPGIGKDVLFTLINPNSIAAMYYGGLMGYYYTHNHGDIGIEGLVGVLPNYIEGIKHGEETRRTNDLFYWGAVAGLTIAGIRKAAIWHKGEAQNEMLYALPAIGDFALAIYNLYRLELPKRIMKHFDIYWIKPDKI